MVTDASLAARGAVFLLTGTALETGRHQADVAYRCGCRVFVASYGILPGKDATVLLTPHVEALVGEMSARLCGHPAREMTVLGITGGTGRTAVALMLEAALRRAGRAASSLTARGLSLCGKESAAGARVPLASEVQQHLREMYECGTEIAVLEFSPYQLSHQAANAIPFVAVLLADVGDDADVQGDGMAAWESFLSLGAPFCVLPVGWSQKGAGRVLTYGAGGDVSAENVTCVSLKGECGAKGYSFLFQAPQGSGEVTLPIPSFRAVEYALGAAALLLATGVEVSEVGKALSAPVAGLLSLLFARDDRAVYADAAYEPHELSRALDDLRGVTKGRLSVLLGSVGGRAKPRRAKLACVAERYADFLYLTADDPDDEDVETIAREMLDAMKEPERAVIIPDREAAIIRAVRELRPGDVLLLSGKGGIAYQLIHGKREPLDEKRIVKRAFASI